MVRLLPVGGAQVGSLEVVVALGVLLTVLVECGRVASGGVLAEGERVGATTHIVVTDLASGLEGLIGLERLLEVHPVL